jgi:acyl-ACP thioesterase
LREFLVEDAYGNTIAESMSAWLLLDVKSKRPQRPNQVLPSELFSENVDQEILPGKLADFEAAEKYSELKVRPFDLDMNNHVNNVSYIRWVEDFCISDSIIFSELLINYISEAVLHEQIVISSIKSDGGFLLSGKSNHKPVFLVSVR